MTRPAPASPAPQHLAARKSPASVRERNKADKRERIRAAARALFGTHDYQAATMRGIAQLAHVGLGTLFSYADDKRDLVFLVFNDDLARLTRRALAAPDPATPVIDQLMAVFTPHYRRFAREPALSRLALQELTFYASGKQAQTFRGIRDELMNGLRALLDRAQARGGLARTAPAGVIAQLVFHVYSGALRTWIAGERPGAANGLRELRQLLELALSGLTRGSVARPD